MPWNQTHKYIDNSLINASEERVPSLSAHGDACYARNSISMMFKAEVWEIQN